MFWAGVIVGALIGSVVTLVIMALLSTASVADDRAEKMDKAIYGSDVDGDD